MPDPQGLQPSEPLQPLSNIALQSGRTLRVVHTEGAERIEISSARGDIELRVTMTPDGPVLSLSGAKLEINSTDAVVVNCREFSVNASEGIALESRGNVALRSNAEIVTKSLGNTLIDAQIIHLNGGDRSDYDDASLPAFQLPPEIAAIVAQNEQPSTPPPPSGDCGCQH